MNKLKRIWHRLSWNRKYPTKKKEYDFIDYKLEYSDNKSLVEEFIKRTEKDKNLRIIIKDGLYATLIRRQTIALHVPMVNKLARLHEKSKN